MLHDDILLFHKINTQHDYHLLQQDINALQSWCSQKAMKFNVSKCKYLVISRKSHPLQPNFHLKIGDSPLTRVAEFKYLGVWLTEKLSWSRHVEFISKTATKAVSVLFRKFYSHASSKTILRMFLTVVRPLLEYAAPVWDPHQLGLISTLERIQKLALRMCAIKGLVC